MKIYQFIVSSFVLFHLPLYRDEEWTWRGEGPSAVGRRHEEDGGKGEHSRRLRMPEVVLAADGRCSAC